MVVGVRGESDTLESDCAWEFTRSWWIRSAPWGEAKLPSASGRDIALNFGKRKQTCETLKYIHLANPSSRVESPKTWNTRLIDKSESDALESNGSLLHYHSFSSVNLHNDNGK